MELRRQKRHLESGKGRTRLYNIWVGMRQRCRDSHVKSYAHYGARGIKVCKEWNDYPTFKKWAMDNGYSDNLTIDRIDVNGNYEPNNCRWATYKQQANNTTHSRYIFFRGEKRTMAEIADILGVSYQTIQHRVYRNRPLEGKQ